MKVVINSCFGGFGLSTSAVMRYEELKGFSVTDYDAIDRNDPALVQVVEEMGELANDRYANLVVIEIPDGIEWEITEYDGMETVEEKHRSWGYNGNE